jgi:hypothetical protein
MLRVNLIPRDSKTNTGRAWTVRGDSGRRSLFFSWPWFVFSVKPSPHGGIVWRAVRVTD